MSMWPTPSPLRAPTPDGDPTNQSDFDSQAGHVGLLGLSVADSVEWHLGLRSQAFPCVSVLAQEHLHLLRGAHTLDVT